MNRCRERKCERVGRKVKERGRKRERRIEKERES